MKLFSGPYAGQLERMMTRMRDEARREPMLWLARDRIMWVTVGMLWSDGVPINEAISLSDECQPFIVRMLELAEEEGR